MIASGVRVVSVPEFCRLIGAGWQIGSPSGSGLAVPGGQLHALHRGGDVLIVLVREEVAP